jgi:imidazoleglycerol phosphate dehydratase HisB
MKTQTSQKFITSIEARYLKSVAAEADIKVTITVADGTPVLHIMDYEFRTFDRALNFIQHMLRDITTCECCGLLRCECFGVSDKAVAQ